MATKLTLDGLPGEIADRARAVFSGVVTDLETLLAKLGSKIGPGPAQRRELLRLIASLRKSFDARLSALERAVAGSGASAAKKSPRKVTKKAVKKVAAKRAARKAAPMKKSTSSVRKATQVARSRNR